MTVRNIAVQVRPFYGDDVVRLHVIGCPFVLEDATLVTMLEPFMKIVHGPSRQKVRLAEGVDVMVESGRRFILGTPLRSIPSTLVVPEMKTRLRLWHEGQESTCWECHQPGHKSRSCPRRQTSRETTVIQKELTKTSTAPVEDNNATSTVEPIEDNNATVDLNSSELKPRAGQTTPAMRGKSRAEHTPTDDTAQEDDDSDGFTPARRPKKKRQQTADQRPGNQAANCELLDDALSSVLHRTGSHYEVLADNIIQGARQGAANARRHSQAANDTCSR